MINIVLFEPEIPQNTGNIMRCCAGTGAKLHLIEPLGFIVDEAHLRRSCVNYWQYVDYKIYKNFDEFLSQNKGVMVFLTRYGYKRPDEIDMSDPSKDYYLILGKESTGIPKEILKDHLDMCVRYPMNDHIRALNLANTACMILYECLRQQGYPGLSLYEPETLKGKDFLKK